MKVRKGQDPIWHRSYRDVSMRKMFDLKFWVYRVIWLSQIVKFLNSRSSPGRNFDRTSVKNHNFHCSSLTLKPDRPIDFKVFFPDLLQMGPLISQSCPSKAASKYFKLMTSRWCYYIPPPEPLEINSVCTFVLGHSILTRLNWLMAITPRNHSRMWWWSWVNFGVAEYKSKIIPILIQFWPDWRSDDIERYLQTHSKHQIHEYTPLHNKKLQNQKMMKYGHVRCYCPVVPVHVKFI